MGGNRGPYKRDGGMYSTLSAWGLEVGGRGGSSSQGPPADSRQIYAVLGPNVGDVYQNINREEHRLSSHHLDEKKEHSESLHKMIIYLLKVHCLVLRKRRKIFIN